jgi:shikimate kinase
VGRAVAEKLNRTFLDFDAEIERREGSTIGEIFGARGEGGFRRLERQVTEELREVNSFVVAPGAGWAANEGCIELVKPPAVLIYLQVEPARALKRMGAETNARPLLRHPNPLAELTRLLQVREPRYLLADHTVRVDFLREFEVVAQIVALAQR